MKSFNTIQKLLSKMKITNIIAFEEKMETFKYISLMFNTIALYDFHSMKNEYF